MMSQNGAELDKASDPVDVRAAYKD